MNLIVDIGNTSTKLAIYKGREIVSVFRINEWSCEEIEKKISGYIIDKAILSSVKDIPPYLADLFFPNVPFVHLLTHRSKVPFTIDYETPGSLGTDRIAAIAGAYSYFPGKEILVIDAGTAITFEYLLKNIYKGGNISPGITMRFKALNRFTRRLPLVTPSSDFSFPGRNTNDAITAGVITGVLYEINEYIRTFEKEHTDFKVILTGGDGGFINNKINYNHTYMPDIVTDGLNFILEYNAK
ncbi:MAG TPA: type III pantothenate kinase [Bacteroidales bacterium]|nr:type III pantothenate kinase [Bacteroidales bacterium]